MIDLLAAELQDVAVGVEVDAGEEFTTTTDGPPQTDITVDSHTKRSV